MKAATGVNRKCSGQMNTPPLRYWLRPAPGSIIRREGSRSTGFPPFESRTGTFCEFSFLPYARASASFFLCGAEQMKIDGDLPTPHELRIFSFPPSMSALLRACRILVDSKVPATTPCVLFCIPIRRCGPATSKLPPSLSLLTRHPARVWSHRTP